MKLAIFGATGRAGKILVAQALEAGYEVAAFARTPSKLGIEHERLSVVQGDIQEAESVASAISGTGAVLSVLGPTSNEPTYEVSKGMANILAAMSEDATGKFFNVGAGGRTTINELFEMVAVHVGMFETPKHGKPRRGDVRGSIADVSEARKWLGYVPAVDAAEGIRRTVQWYRERF